MTRTKALKLRATTAYFRAGGLNSPTRVYVVESDYTYVVLQFRQKTLAVYRLLNNGSIKSRKRWPRTVAAPFERPALAA